MPPKSLAREITPTGVGDAREIFSGSDWEMLKGERQFKRFSKCFHNRMYSLTLSALAYAKFKVKVIRFHKDCYEDAGSWIDFTFFHPSCGNFQNLSHVLDNLQTLQLNISLNKGTQGGFARLASRLGGHIDRIKGPQQGMLPVIAEVAPSIQDLSVAGRVTSVKGLKKERNKDWPHLESGLRFGKLLLKPGPTQQLVTFRYLRKLHLDTLVFDEHELKSFLLRHQSSLRHLTLHRCLLHSPYQTWSRVFQFVGTELSLQVFEYEIVSWAAAIVDADRLNWLWVIKVIPWFRFYGDVKANGECCELLSKETALNGDPPYKVNFTNALAVVRRLEDMFILGDQVPIRWSDRDRGLQNYVGSVREGTAEDRMRFHMDPLFRFFIRPRDIKDAIKHVRLEQLAMLRAQSRESESETVIPTGKFGQE
ncbi:hypothetical protein ABW21_db0204436 [Orbilia brochopaga]|nr:hypothetical protein ABW21_db0204436 [Drechslerella brochopaga]